MPFTNKDKWNGILPSQTASKEDAFSLKSMPSPKTYTVNEDKKRDSHSHRTSFTHVLIKCF